MPLVNALVIGNLFEYRYKSLYCQKLDSLGYISVGDSMSLISATYT